MRVGVIGGLGFLGASLRKRLERSNFGVRIFDVRGGGDDSASYLDISSTVKLEGCDDLEVLINLAAEHRDDVRPLSKYADVNIQGARNCCEIARRSDISKIIFTSSVAVYGFAEPDAGEDAEINFFNEYGRTKYLAENIYKEWQAEDPEVRTLIIVRPTVIFGPGNRGNVYNLLRQIAERKFMMFGSGLNVKSMAYVDNVASFLVHCLQFSSGVHVYNYVDKPDLSMNELVQVARKTLFHKSGVGLRMPRFLGITIGVAFDLLAWLIRKPLPISSIRVKKFMATTQFSSAVPATGFEAPYTLAEGLEKTLRYEFLEDNRGKPTYEAE